MCYNAACATFSTHCAGEWVGKYIYHADIVKPYVGDVTCVAAGGCCCDEVLANLAAWGFEPGGGGNAAFKCLDPNKCRWSCADGAVWDRGGPYNVDEFEWTC